MNIETIETPELGNRSYVVDDGTSAVVIDPQRDLDRVEGVLEHRGVSPAHVLETHIHNDYVTGGFELARRTGAAYGVNALDPVRFERLPLHDDDILLAGGLQVRVVATPGHTDTHLAYLVTDESGASAVFSGGSLLFGSVGRTDLIDPARTRDLAGAQYRSAQRLRTLSPAAALCPTHGFGSFCSSGTTGGDAIHGTVADEKLGNPAFTAPDEAAFVEDLVASLGAYPTYYSEMAPLNLAGPRPADLAGTPYLVEPSDVTARIAAGEAVIDLRDRVAYSAAHASGTLSINLGAQLATYVGWLVPFGTRITLLAQDVEQLAEARRQLCRIGYDDIVGAIGSGAFVDAKRSYERRTFDDIAAGLGPDDLVLDVRRDEERSGGHLTDSLHVPLHDLRSRLGSLPRRRMWVHCVSGFRAGTAASILEDAGFDVVQVDDHIDHADALHLVTH